MDIEDALRAFTGSIRQLERTPGFTILVIFELSLALGGLLLFSNLIFQYILSPITYGHHGQVVQLWQKPLKSDRIWQVSPGVFREWRSSLHLIQPIIAFVRYSATLDPATHPRRVIIERVSSGYFSFMRMHLISGSSQKTMVNHSAIISNRLWRSSMGGHRDAIGSLIQLGNMNYRIVGIAHRTYYPGNVDVWLPLARDRNSRSAHALTVLGILRPGISLQKCRNELISMARHDSLTYPATDAGWTAGVEPLAGLLLGKARYSLELMYAAMIVIFLLCVASTMNLFIERTYARHHDRVIRHCLGAGRSYLLLDLTAEPFLLIISAWAIGLLFAWAARGPVWHLLAGDQTRRLPSPAFDWRLPLLVGFICLAVFAMAALAATITLNRTENRQGAGFTVMPWRGQISRVLAAVGVMLTVWVLLSVWPVITNLRSVEHPVLGFEFHHLYIAQFGLPYDQFQSNTRKWEYLQALLKGSLRHGAAQAGLTSDLPFGRPQENFRFNLRNGWKHYRARYRAISINYLRMLQVPLLHGRFFNHMDSDGNQWVAIVNSAWVHKYSLRQNPIGTQISIDGPHGPWRTIIGVAANVHENGIVAMPSPEMYFPIPQELPWTLTLVVRPRTVMLAPQAWFLNLFHSLKAPVFPYHVGTITAEVKSDATIPVSQGIILGYGVLYALSIAVFGIYAITARMVRERIREIGIRMALGACPMKIFIYIARFTMYPVLIGTIGGILLSIGANDAIRSINPSLKASSVWTDSFLIIVIFIACIASIGFTAIQALRYNPAWIMRRI